jgi:ubiquitin C-terminal hydrolase
MNFVDYENIGLSGLANLGNTCFVNSCIQILYHTYELAEYSEALTQQYQSDTADFLLLREWVALKKILWSKKCIVAPNRFIHVLHKVSSQKNAIFSDFSQNDSSEFLIFLLNSFHSGMPKWQEKIQETAGNALNVLCKKYINTMIEKEDYSKITELFYGIKVTILINAKQEILSTIPESFFVFHLPIPKKREPTIEECFELFMEDEILEGDNGIINETTQQKEDVVKRTLLWELPKILIIDFQRFKFTNVARKTQDFIKFTEQLDLSKYTRSSSTYQLYGISNHSGSVNGGHYTSYIKNRNGKWYHYNDTIVKEIPPGEIVSTKAYCLFYRKI